MLRISFVLLVLWGSMAILCAQNLERIGQLSYAPRQLAGCWHHVDQSGGEWALVGTSGGLSIVDLKNPAQPVQRFEIPSEASNWREVKTWAGFAYFSSEAPLSGITIVNLNYLPDSIQWKVWRGDGFFANKVEECHTLQAVDGYLYLCGGKTITEGVVIANLVDPWNPHIVSKYAANYVHDAFIRGNTLWTSEIKMGQFGVVDITNKSNPVLITTQPTPGAYNHNSGLSDDSKTLFTTDEVVSGPLGAFDVSDLNDIKLLDTYLPSKKPTGEVHNVRVMPGDFLICPSYDGQLTIVDGSQPDNLIEIAHDSLGVSLVWDADPYLPSGIVLATAKKEGLFVYKKPAYTHAAWLQGTVSDATTGFPLIKAKVFILNTPNADTTGADGVYKTGAAKTGSYVLRVECEGYQPKVMSNISLTSGIITTLNIALVPLVVGVKSPENETFARVSPTIFEDHLKVECLDASPFKNGETKFYLSDSSGKTVLEHKASPSGITVLDGLKALPSGVYFLRLVNGRERAVFQVMKF